MSETNDDAEQPESTERPTPNPCSDDGEPDSDGVTQVAIACQGGGSHTAFTAGALRELLSAADWEEEFELVGISGTSGGAFNALAVWYGLVTGDEAKAIDLLERIWSDMAASDYPDMVVNQWVSLLSRFQSEGVGIPNVSPYYSPGSDWGQQRIVDILERHIEFENIPALCAYEEPELVVGTVNVNDGAFETFTNEDVTADAVLASAAIPTLFEAVEIDGESHWDGLFSQNPPVKDLMSVPGDRTPDELWVIQINPQEREGTPTRLPEITDRRNELAGNISLNQELRTIERINEWIEDGHFDHPEYTQTTIRRLQLRGYHHSTKLDRDPDFLEELIEHGAQEGAAFLEGLNLEDDVEYPARQ
ncbi:patatin-like phospholipase family protein [Natronorubrum sp. JWXQ-INN-674]|uniref:Patatin-like phospholipase family protein n=1 Tax=Natronorubrum halalkaliphilum TaxID=2691917 RepID=A0A6B0VRB2_9EURY|nr:patatin-like phospholipase family protein [Natronorubrum halalkaliphilum]MXV64381.1 patatin-like phospholipase family protein [Natronorubrum halalkaliphilum]